MQVPNVEISSLNHAHRIGLSDAYLSNHAIKDHLVRVITLYDKINLDREKIKSGVSILLEMDHSKTFAFSSPSVISIFVLQLVIRSPTVPRVWQIEANDTIARGVTIFRNAPMVSIVRDNNGFVRNAIDSPRKMFVRRVSKNRIHHVTLFRQTRLSKANRFRIISSQIKAFRFGKPFVRLS
jgi:hypothetical protein